MKVIKDIEQGSQEWHELRRGKVTGTCLADVMGTPLARHQLIAELIAEEGTEQTKVLRPSVEMERGIAEEVFTIKRYEEKFSRKVEKVTICISDDYDWLAYSPDGLILENGQYKRGLEVKNPDSKTMIFYKMTNLIPDIKLSASKTPFLGVPNEYKWQVVLSFIVNNQQEVLDFVISDARFIDDEAKMYVIEVRRDNPLLQQAIQEAETQLESFRKEWLKCKELVLLSNF